jgi:uncharacterized SAM-binding protein YcdF (DUF218 family)
MKSLVLIVFFLFGIIASIGLYLSPDDLSDCGATPGTSSGCQKADTIVAVSGGDTTARTNEAIDLYQNGWADRLVFSGAALDKSGPSNAAAMREIAIESGVPEEAITVEEFGETTRQNAEKTGSILAETDSKSVILVTSGYHQRRAGLEFQWRLGDNVNIINHPVKSDEHWSGLWWLTPGGWYLAVSELTKIVAFYFGGSR